MKYIIQIIFLLLVTCQFAKAELDPKTVKQLEKAKTLTAKNKFEPAEKIYRSIIDKHPYYATAWNEYATFGITRYNYHQNNDRFFNISVKGGSDSLTKVLAELLAGIKPSVVYYDKFINICREATLKNEYAYYPSIFLRNYLFDKKIDKNIKDTAKYHYRIAEKHFGNGNYTVAATQYQIAINLDTNFYQAKLYLGDSYYMLKEYVTAAKYFRNAIITQPTLVEPRKFLVDALSNMDAYDEAIEECIQSLLIYPDVAMFIKLNELTSNKGNKFNRKWIFREIFPTTNNKQPLPNAKGSWQHYLDAKTSFDTSYYNLKTGLIKDNPTTKHKYIEVYCWEQMLKNAPENEFKYAREMQAKGYLDCYVLFSLFHNDCLAQYTELSKTDRSRLRTYIDLLSL